MSWLSQFAQMAARSDELPKDQEHSVVLALGLFGEVGSVLAEGKKVRRERAAYSGHKERFSEEIGDILWYFARLCAEECPAALEQCATSRGSEARSQVEALSALGLAAGQVLKYVGKPEQIEASILSFWESLREASASLGLDLASCAAGNERKRASRWPATREFLSLFDEGEREEEQLPRNMDIEFRCRSGNGRDYVLLRTSGVNIGDRVSDNIMDPDYYRFHDVFHLAHAVFLGWSPVLRSVLRCKRKSNPRVDEAEDGARAAIIEEAISAFVFSWAKGADYFADGVEYDLLKTIRKFVAGYEVENVPLWQWETAILEGYRVFKALRDNNGGVVRLSLRERRLEYVPA